MYQPKEYYNRPHNGHYVERRDYHHEQPSMTNDYHLPSPPMQYHYGPPPMHKKRSDRHYGPPPIQSRARDERYSGPPPMQYRARDECYYESPPMQYERRSDEYHGHQLKQKNNNYVSHPPLRPAADNVRKHIPDSYVVSDLSNSDKINLLKKYQQTIKKTTGNNFIISGINNATFDGPVCPVCCAIGSERHKPFHVVNESCHIALSKHLLNSDKKKSHATNNNNNDNNNDNNKRNNKKKSHKDSDDEEQKK
jgi:hypothetical protein